MNMVAVYRMVQVVLCGIGLFGVSCVAKKEHEEIPQVGLQLTELSTVLNNQRKYSGTYVSLSGYVIDSPSGWYFAQSMTPDWRKSSDFALIWNAKTKHDLDNFKRAVGKKVKINARYQAYRGLVLDVPSPQGGMLFEVAFLQEQMVP